MMTATIGAYAPFTLTLIPAKAIGRGPDDGAEIGARPRKSGSRSVGSDSQPCQVRPTALAATRLAGVR